MKSHQAWISIAAAMALAATTPTVAAEDLIVKIGHATPLTGSFSFAGKIGRAHV